MKHCRQDCVRPPWMRWMNQAEHDKRQTRCSRTEQRAWDNCHTKLLALAPQTQPTHEAVCTTARWHMHSRHAAGPDCSVATAARHHGGATMPVGAGAAPTPRSGGAGSWGRLHGGTTLPAGTGASSAPLPLAYMYASSSNLEPLATQAPPLNQSLHSRRVDSARCRLPACPGSLWPPHLRATTPTP